MTVTTTLIPTQNANRYMTQLCKHWSHRFDTTLTENTGTASLPGGLVSFDASETTLKVVLSPKSDETRERMKEVVEEHLNRFAFREAPLEIAWSD